MSALARCCTLQGIAPYNPEALGVSDRLPPLAPADDEQLDSPRRRTLAERQRSEQRRLEAAQATWRPWSDTPVLTVADVAPLRWMAHVAAGAPLPSSNIQAGNGGDISSGGALGGAAAPNPQQQQQQQQQEEARRGQEQWEPNVQPQPAAAVQGQAAGEQEEDGTDGNALDDHIR
jgi:hypothetical protein